MNSYIVRLTHAEWEAIASRLGEGDSDTLRGAVQKLGAAMDAAASIFGSKTPSQEITVCNGSPTVSATLNPHNLSQRENRILHHLTTGASNKEIARSLVITESTVKVHMKSILRKLRVKNRTTAAMWATENMNGASKRG